MNKRWLVLLAPLGVAVGGVAGASALPPAPAPTTVPEGLAEGQEAVSAQECFDGSMSSCDILWSVAESPSPAEQYGATCGGRLPDGIGNECMFTFADASAAAPATEPAASPPASTGDAPVPPPEETALARMQFDAALTANGIDPATTRMVACTSEYSTALFDPSQPVISGVCFGLVGEVSPDPNAAQPILYGANTIHSADGGVITFFFKYSAPEVIGDPMPGEPTAPITFPPAGAAATPTTAAGATDPAAGTIDPNAALVQQHLQGLNVTITEEQADCMLDLAGGDASIVVADIGVTSDLAAQCGVDMSTMSG